MIFRAATAGDVPAIVALLADDVLGARREAPGDPAYAQAFAAIAADANQLLAVADVDGRVVGCLQLTFTPGLSHRGAWRGQVESVRIAADQRGTGLGRRFLEWAIEHCRARGCRMVQLTTDKSRADARRFYESLGFTASHEGMKLAL
ncbi:GNAT family N-acetyltransferase [Roseomonas sp. CECT 9278]|uniref:GNAT family N-acetyltransferase n=1 Tax=Roseomonas sp. CECT 9278 TaxID=2845823 RepID=UPI001E5583B9|nr:GNAT family N-acetyltransferase [Roseomonas sp. CECT 9278]CAH0246366.1 Aminoalkylphosphonate N-acetyltransferase [Roseomonas sp. CECT 9278]